MPLHATAETDDVRAGCFRVRVSRHTGRDPDRAPLLLLMGLGGNLEMWQPLRRLLEEGGGMPTVAVDVPGTGGSPATLLPLPMPLVGWLATRLLDALELNEVDVLGLSWGGLLAQQLAVMNPRRVRRLVLINTNFGVGSVPGRPTALQGALEQYRSRMGIASARDAASSSTHPQNPNTCPRTGTRSARPPSRRGLYWQILTGATWSSIGFLPLLSPPTLVLAGGDDTVCPPVNARILARLIPRARLQVVPGAGHLLPFESPELTAAAVLQHLAADHCRFSEVRNER